MQSIIVALNSTIVRTDQMCRGCLKQPPTVVYKHIFVQSCFFSFSKRLNVKYFLIDGSTEGVLYSRLPILTEQSLQTSLKIFCFNCLIGMCLIC